jgi:hypothetical protein
METLLIAFKKWSGKNTKVISSVKRDKKILGDGGTRTWVSASKQSSALQNFMIVAPLSYQAISTFAPNLRDAALHWVLKLNAREKD